MMLGVFARVVRLRIADHVRVLQYQRRLQ